MNVIIFLENVSQLVMVEEFVKQTEVVLKFLSKRINNFFLNLTAFINLRAVLLY
jgi:hypothetical protein